MSENKYTFEEIKAMFYGKKMYEKKIIRNKIKIVPTKNELKLRLIISKQHDRAEGYHHSISNYFGLSLPPIKKK